MDKEKLYELRTASEEIIPGTDINGVGIRRPDDRQPTETDEEYVEYLKWYYQKYFSNPQEFTSSENKEETNQTSSTEVEEKDPINQEDMFHYTFDLEPEKEVEEQNANDIIIDTSFDEELDNVKSSNPTLNAKIRNSSFWQKGKIYLQKVKTVAINLIEKANDYCMDISDAIAEEEAKVARVR